MPVERLYLIAPMPVDFYRLGPFRVRIDGLRQPLDELGTLDVLRLYLRSNDPLTRRPYRRGRQWLSERPWRRVLGRLGAIRSAPGLPLTPRLLQADVRVERFELHARLPAGSGAHADRASSTRSGRPATPRPRGGLTSRVR